MNTKAKGNRQEARSIALLESQGYACTRSAASLGAWDVIGIRRDGIVLCQTKSNRYPGSAEMATMRAFEAPDNALKVIHVWDDGKPEPRVRVL